MSKDYVIVTFHVERQGSYISLGFADENLITQDRIRYPVSYGESQAWSNWCNRAKWSDNTVAAFTADGWTCAIPVVNLPVHPRVQGYTGDSRRINPGRFDAYVRMAMQTGYVSPSIVK